MVATPNLYFTVDHYREHGFDHTRVRVFEADARSLVDLIDGCVDNKAGYGSAEAAAHLLREYSELQQRGYSHVAERGYGLSGGRSVTFTWLHSTSVGYCSPNVDCGQKWEKIGRNVSLAQQIATRTSKLIRRTYDMLDAPDDVIGALLLLGATECEDSGRGRFRTGDPVYPMLAPRSRAGLRDAHGKFEAIASTRVRKSRESGLYELRVLTESGHEHVEGFRTRARAEIARQDLLRQQALGRAARELALAVA